MRTLFLFLLLYIQVKVLHGQCNPPLAEPTEVCGTGTVLIDNANISTGQTYYTNGGSFSNITISGGTLLICGTATLTNTNFNSGTLTIRPGGSGTFNGSFNAGAPLQFFNYSIAVFNTTVNIQGSTNFIYNAPAATITTTNSLSILNSGQFINNGTLIAQAVNITTGAVICFGPGSVSRFLSVNNDQSNSIAVPSGIACLSYSTTFTGNQPITNTPNLRICRLSGSSAPVAAAIGAATVVNPCSSCSFALPVLLESFKGSEFNGNVTLKWVTATEENVRSFIIESSTDGRNFSSVGEVAANNRPTTYNYTTTISQRTYFRLKMVDVDSRFSYSSIVVLDPGMKSNDWRVMANPITNSTLEISVTVGQPGTADIILTDKSGRLQKKVRVNLVRGNNFIRQDIAGLLAGQYFVQLIFSDGNRSTKPVVVL